MIYVISGHCYHTDSCWSDNFDFNWSLNALNREMHIHTQQISVLPSAETVAAAEGWLRISVAWPSSTELQVRKQKLQKESVVEVRCPPLFNKRPRFQTLTVWRAKTQTGPRRDRNTGTHTQWHNLTHTHIRGTVLCGCKVEQCWLSALSESTLKTQRLETDSGRAVNYTQTRTHSASNTNLLEKWMWCSLSFTSLKKTETNECSNNMQWVSDARWSRSCF